MNEAEYQNIILFTKIYKKLQKGANFFCYFEEKNVKTM